MKTSLCLALTLAFLISCETATEVPEIDYAEQIIYKTYSFECFEDCALELIINEETKSFTLSGKLGANSPRTYSESTTETEWNDLQQLIASTNFANLDSIYIDTEIIDGGSQTIEIISPDLNKKVTLQNTSVPQLEVLIETLREIRGTITPK